MMGCGDGGVKRGCIIKPVHDGGVEGIVFAWTPCEYFFVENFKTDFKKRKR